MNELQVYTHPDFGSLEIWVDSNEKPWFPAKESANALGYSNDRDAIAKHCDEKGVAFRDVLTPGGTQKKKYINRPNLSRLIARSHLPEAAKFESWIFDDVLESVFDHGGYLTPDKIEEVQNDPDTIIALAQQLKKERAQRAALETTVSAQGQLLQEMRPKATYYDLILQTNDALAITTIAKDYGKSGRWMNAKLHDLGVQYLQGDIWLLYQAHAAEGYTTSKTHAYTDSEGVVHSKMRTYWTQKGRLFIYELLKRHGIHPIIEVNQPVA